MKHQKKLHHSPQRKNLCAGFLFLLVMGAPLYGQTSTPDPATDTDIAKLRQVGEQFQDVHNQIHEIQVKATQTKAVQKVQKEFTDAMNKAMLKIDPEIEEDLKRSNELLEKIRSHPQINDPRAREQDLELKKMLLDYQYLERNMTPVRREAAEEPECKEKFEKFQSTILAEMKKIDPNTQDLMDRKEKLASEYRDLRKIVRADQS